VAIFSFKVIELASPECTVGALGYSERWWTSAMSPFLVMAIFYVFGTILKFVKKQRGAMWRIISNINQNLSNSQQSREVKFVANAGSPSASGWELVSMIDGEAAQQEPPEPGKYKIKYEGCFLEHRETLLQDQLVRLVSKERSDSDMKYQYQIWELEDAGNGAFRIINQGYYLDNCGKPDQDQEVKLSSIRKKSTESNHKDQLWKFKFVKGDDGKLSSLKIGSADFPAFLYGFSQKESTRLDRIWRTILNTMVFVYITGLMTAMEPWVCSKYDSDKTWQLEAQPSIKCGSSGP
jgi:hypothetical protein